MRDNDLVNLLIKQCPFDLFFGPQPVPGLSDKPNTRKNNIQ